MNVFLIVCCLFVLGGAFGYWCGSLISEMLRRGNKIKQPTVNSVKRLDRGGKW